MPHPVGIIQSASTAACTTPCVPAKGPLPSPVEAISSHQQSQIQLVGSSAVTKAVPGKSQHIVTPIAPWKTSFKSRPELSLLGPMPLSPDPLEPIFPIVVPGSSQIPDMVIGDGYITIKKSGAEDDEGSYKLFSPGVEVSTPFQYPPVRDVAILAIKDPKRNVQVLAEDNSVKQYSSKYIISPSERVLFAGGKLYLVQDLATEGNAADFAKLPGTTLEDVITIVKHTAKGLKEIHAKGNIHRDVKPLNILVWRLPNGKLLAKLADFGFHIKASKASPLTVPGTPGFIPARALTGIHAQTADDDMYALGETLMRPYVYVASKTHCTTGFRQVHELVLKLESDYPPTAQQTVTELQKIAKLLAKQPIEADTNWKETLSALASSSSLPTATFTLSSEPGSIANINSPSSTLQRLEKAQEERIGSNSKG